MAVPTSIRRDYRPSYVAAGITAGVVLVLYLLTLAPTTAMWDTSEYIASAYVLGNPHPPGNPLFVLIGHLFAMLPLGSTVARRVNVLAALTSALAAGCWFLVAERVLVGWFADRWQRVVGGVVAAVIGATEYTVWNQSVVNEKVYTLSLFGLAVVSWLTVRWSDEPDGPAADRLLVLIAYLLGLGYSTHMMGFLAGPAVAVAVLVRRPRTLRRWRLLLACAAALAFGVTVFAYQPLRAAHFPAINEGEPTGCRSAFGWACTFSGRTWHAFVYNFNRGQYAKPSVFDRQAPFQGQLGMWWMYFKWQWLRDMRGRHGSAQQLLGMLYLGLGLLGGRVHWQRDRRSFWYFGTFMVTLTLLLIFYLNFKYGQAQCLTMPDVPDAQCEVRDRDYFFIVSFSVWGVWAALGLLGSWTWVASRVPDAASWPVRGGSGWSRRRAFLLASPVLVLAVVPLVGNWHAASRAGQSDARDFAHDLLDSVEPYGMLVTVGDNDTFPLWFAQEVEGYRMDVVVANTSLLNTDWYVRQMLRRPVYTYEAARGPAVYRSGWWPKPSGPPLRMTLDEADQIPEIVPLEGPQSFRKVTPQGTITAVVPVGPGYLERAELIVLLMIRDAYPKRPLFLSRTTGGLGARLGLTDYLITQGLVQKLSPVVPRAGRGIVKLRDGWLDLPRARARGGGFHGPASLLRRGDWVDQASVGIPLLYVATALGLAGAEQAVGDTAAARTYGRVAQALTAAVGVQ